jgi:hypothetical protein
LNANAVSRGVPAVVLVPCATIGAPGADADAASISQSPAAKKPAIGRLASIDQPAGTPVNQVGGSTMAVSLDGYAPVIGLAAPPVLSQKTMPLRPLPERVRAVRPVARPPFVMNCAPPAPPPM